MATCPDCGGYLDDAHVCSGKLRRRRRQHLLASAATGALVGGTLPLLLTGRLQNPLVAVLFAALGAVVAVSVSRAVPR